MNEYMKQLVKLPNKAKIFLFIEALMGMGIGIWNVNLNFFFSSRGLTPAEIGRNYTQTPLNAAR